MSRQLKWLSLVLLATMLMGRIWAMDSEKMGRNFLSGQKLPEELIQVLEINSSDRSNPQALNIVFFSRPEQDYSMKMKDDIINNFTVNKDLFSVTEFSKNASSELPLQDNWAFIRDADFSYYEKFGVMVQPSLFIFSANYELAAYIAGWSPVFPDKLYDVFTRFFPDEYPLRKEYQLPDDEKKKQSRRESMITELYKKEQYQIALMQLMTMDSLSEETRLLKGKIYLNLRKNEEALEIFSAEFRENPGEASLGYAIACFQLGRYREASDSLDAISTIHGMYKVNYWKARCHEKLGEKDKALREYRRAIRQMITAGHLEIY